MTYLSLSFNAMRYACPPKPLNLRSLGVGGWRRQALCDLLLGGPTFLWMTQQLQNVTFGVDPESFFLVLTITLVFPLSISICFYMDLYPNHLDLYSYQRMDALCLAVEAS